jgi:hypothetical protein
VIGSNFIQGSISPNLWESKGMFPVMESLFIMEIPNFLRSLSNYGHSGHWDWSDSRQQLRDHAQKYVRKVSFRYWSPTHRFVNRHVVLRSDWISKWFSASRIRLANKQLRTDGMNLTPMMTPKKFLFAKVFARLRCFMKKHLVDSYSFWYNMISGLENWRRYFGFDFCPAKCEAF